MALYHTALARRWIRQQIPALQPEHKLIYADVPKPYGKNRHWFACTFDRDQFITIPVATQSFVTASAGTNQTLTSDATCNNSSNAIDVVGGGSSGAANCRQTVGAGGSGGGG